MDKAELKLTIKCAFSNQENCDELGVSDKLLMEFCEYVAGSLESKDVVELLPRVLLHILDNPPSFEEADDRERSLLHALDVNMQTSILAHKAVCGGEDVSDRDYLVASLTDTFSLITSEQSNAIVAWLDFVKGWECFEWDNDTIASARVYWSKRAQAS